MTGTRGAREQERAHVERLLHDVFRDDPVSRWLFPGEVEREAFHPRVFAAFLAASLAHGTVEVTVDGAGAALWFSVRDGVMTGGDELRELLDGVAPGNERLGVLGASTAARHPSADHAYLQAIAVTPASRRRGLASALLAPTLERCDRSGLGAYLEASNEGSRALYLRHGFEDSGEPLELPDGPPMWPMWREPAARQ